jgi:hypothetical protein
MKGKNRNKVVFVRDDFKAWQNLQNGGHFKVRSVTSQIQIIIWYRNSYRYLLGLSFVYSSENHIHPLRNVSPIANNPKLFMHPFRLYFCPQVYTVQQPFQL